LDKKEKKIIPEAKVLSDKSNDILRQAAGRIFENIDSRHYHLSIVTKFKNNELNKFCYIVKQ